MFYICICKTVILYVPRYVVRVNAMQCNAMQCNAMQCNAMQCNAMQCNAMQCNAMQCNAMQCNAMQCNAMQCNAMQCNPMQCNAIQCNPIQFKTDQSETVVVCALFNHMLHCRCYHAISYVQCFIKKANFSFRWNLVKHMHHFAVITDINISK